MKLIGRNGTVKIELINTYGMTVNYCMARN